MLNLKVVNLYGAPGVGKSVTAAGLYNLMSMRGHKVELVTEFAKDLTWGKNWLALDHQLSILAEQDRRLRVLEGQVEYAITDSPLPTGIAYMGAEYEGWLDKATWSAYDRYFNYHVLLHRNKELGYQEHGRNQNLEAAMVLDNVLDCLFSKAITEEEDFSLELTTNSRTVYDIYDWLAEQEGWPDHGAA